MRWLPIVALCLSACSAEIPPTFADPAAELDRLVRATAADCRQERRDYWFCTAEGGFFHLYTVQPAGAARLVERVMIEKGASSKLERDLLALYGFAAEDLAVLAAELPVRKGGFELALDTTWKQAVIRTGFAD